MSDISIPANPRFIDLTGHSYGRLSVLCYAGKRKTKHRWLCECYCGNQIVAGGGDLRSGNTASCGCLVSDLTASRNRTHGLSNLPEYKTWKGMISRCYNKSGKNFALWGGRGISVHDSWRTSFRAFYDHVGPKPSPKHSIDRIDNSGNYEPGNVRWATPTEQIRNRRKQRNQTGTTGVYFASSGSRYVANIRSGKKLFYLGTFDTIEEAAAARKAGEVKYWGH